MQDARRECAERTGFQRKGFHWKSGSGGKGYHDRPGAHRPASRRGQHLLPPADTLPAAGGPCGPSDPVLPPEPPCPAIRGGEGGPCETLDPPGRAAPLSRSGTCPVFSTQGGRPSSALRYPGGGEVVSRERKACLTDCVPDGLSAGPALREERKASCRSAGRTPEEKANLFDGWGSLPQALCEAGRICPAADGKVFRRCPGFLPMEENAARRDALPLLFPLRPRLIPGRRPLLRRVPAALTPLLRELPLKEETWQEGVRLLPGWDEPPGSPAGGPPSGGLPPAAAGL